MTEVEQKFNKAEQFFNEKKYLHALQIYQSLFNESSLQRKVTVRLIEIFDMQKQINHAINVFTEYLNRNENDENMRTFYAQFLIRHKMYTEANDALSGISVSARPEKNFLMGMVSFYLDDFDIAAINFSEFIEKNSKSDLLAEAYLYLAKCSYKNNELDQALVNLKESEKIYSGNYQLHLTFAEVYYLNEMYFHALASIQKSLKLNPVELDSLRLSGKIFFKLGEYKKARKEFELIVDKVQNDSELMALLGYVCFKEHDIEKANAYFKKALAINPANEIALSGLNQCKALIK